MSKDRQRLVDYLAHIVEAIERIDRYTKTWMRSLFCRTS